MRTGVLSLCVAVALTLSGCASDIKDAFREQNEVGQHLYDRISYAEEKGDEKTADRLYAVQDHVNKACSPLQAAGGFLNSIFDDPFDLSRLWDLWMDSFDCKRAAGEVSTELGIKGEPDQAAKTEK